MALFVYRFAVLWLLLLIAFGSIPKDSSVALSLAVIGFAIGAVAAMEIAEKASPGGGPTPAQEEEK